MNEDVRHVLIGAFFQQQHDLLPVLPNFVTALPCSQLQSGSKATTPSFKSLINLNKKRRIVVYIHLVYVNL